MKKIRELFDLRDAHVYLGIVLICVGLCLAYIPAGLAVTGGILVWLGTRRVD